MNKILLLLFLLPIFSFGQIAQRGSSTTNSTYNAALSINRPAGIVSGDVLILNIAQRGDKKLSNPAPSGWILIDGLDLGQTGSVRRQASVYYKIATAAEPNSYTITLDKDHNGSTGSIIAFSGVDVSGVGSSPFDVVPGSITGSNSNTATATALTTVSPNAAIIMLTQAIGNDPFYSNWTTTSPGTLTELYDDGISGVVSIGAAWAIKSSAGDTGTGSTSLTVSERNGAILLALKPDCPAFSLTSVTATDACTSPGTSNVTVTGSSASLPIGSYTVEYRLSYDSYSTVYTAPMTIATAGNGTFTANVSVVNVSSSTRVRVDRLTSGSCSSNLSTNNVSNILFKRVTLGKPGISAGYASCSIWKAQWNNESADGYYLDVASTNTFAPGTFLSGYDNLQIVGYPSSYDITGLTQGNTYYYRVRSYNYCGTSVNSNVISFIAGGAVAPIVGSITQPTCSSTTGSFTISNYNASYSYTISPATGVSRSGSLVTAPAGSYTLSTTYSGCTSQTTNFTINNQPAGPSAPSIGSITQPSCSSTTGSFTISNYNASHSYTITPLTGVSRSGAIVTAPEGIYSISANVSGCSSSNTSFTINAQPAGLAAPLVGTTTQPSCTVATGGVVLNGLPSGSWILTRTPGNITTVGTGASKTITGLSPGTYSYTVDNSNNGSGLKGDYFNNMTLSGSPTLTRTDANVNFNWGGGSPDPSIPNNTFSVRWSGLIQPLFSETYTFSTTSDDGIRLWVNGVQIINNWTNHAATVDTGTISLTAGIKYNIVLEYYENGGQAVSTLSWSSPSQSLQIIPQSQLYLSGSCSSTASANVVINAQPATPVVPTIGAISPEKCNILGSVILSGLPATWTLNRTGSSSATTSGTGTSTTISGLAAGTYQFTVSNGSCSSGATSNIVINPAVTNTWNGSVWSNGTPTLNDKIVFAANYPPSPDPNVDVLGCSCRITGSTKVVIKSGRTLKITNEVDVQPTATLTFENGASLVQINDTPTTPNTGNIKYQRETTPISNMDYTYWSSPVAAQTLYNLSPNTLGDKFYSFDSGIDNWKSESSATTMAVGKGYIVRGPQNYAAPLPPNIYLANFIGVPHNGVKSTPIGVAGNSNLLGNPYPSALDADSFLTANSGVLEGTIYFWTHNTNIGKGVSNPGSGIYAYSSDDYASYNLTGGVGTQPATSSGPNTNTPSGKIASGQAFFTTSKAAGNAIFNNSMRVGVGSITGDNSQFFKNASNTKSNTTTIEKNRLWLNLYNDQDAFKQTLIGYVTGATNEFDSSFDGESYDSNEFLDFYSINEDKNLVIQGRALPFDVSDEVPLGYSSTIVGELKIAIGQVDGSLENSNVFLEDKLLKITHNLNESPYSFTTEKGVFNDRFIVSYANKTLAIKDFVDSKSGVLISNKNKEILIKSSDVLINKVFVYDFSGKQLYKKIKVEHHENKILHLGVPDQVLIVKVVLQNGKTVSKKILF